MLYELTLFATYFGQQIVNRFNYVMTGTIASVQGSFALTSAFGLIPNLTVYPIDRPFWIMTNIQSTAVVYQSAVVRAASTYAVQDFYERPFVGGFAGRAAASEGMSPTVAFGFRTNRIRLDIDRGTKRLAGVGEAAVGAGGVIEASTLTAMNTIATAWSTPLVYDDEGSAITFTPCVVSKQDYITPSGKKAYRYYPTLAEQMENVAVGVSWQPYPQVRTQTSRQYGRGI